MPVLPITLETYVSDPSKATPLTDPEPVVSIPSEPSPVETALPVTKVNSTEKTETVLKAEPIEENQVPEEPIAAQDKSTAETQSFTLNLNQPLKEYTITQYYSAHHRGLDLAADIGTPIQAVSTGCVKISYGYNGGYGNMIEQDISNGYSVRYAHLSHFASYLEDGVCVNQGDIIGYVGSTGRSTGPHLHFELYRYGISLKPIFNN